MFVNLTVSSCFNLSLLSTTESIVMAISAAFSTSLLLTNRSISFSASLISLNRASDAGGGFTWNNKKYKKNTSANYYATEGKF